MKLVARVGLVLVILTLCVGIGVITLRVHRHTEVAKPPAADSAPSEPVPVTLNELRAWKDGTVLIDVRPRLFFEEGHIPHAINIDKEYFARDFAHYADGLKRHGETKLVVYCSSEDCDDSDFVARELIQSGLTPVYVFTGGWSAWQGEKLPEEKGAASQTSSL